MKSNQEERKQTKKKQAFSILLTAITAAALLVYLLWRAFCTLPDAQTYGYVALFAGLGLLLAEGLSVLEALFHYFDLNRHFEPPCPDIPPDWWPEVDVLVTTHNEDVNLLFKTVNGCVRMEYPDKSKVHIYICDDTDRPEMRELAEQLGVAHIGLRDNKDAKAGNLNNAISRTGSPLIVTFDADMIPNSEFLMETVPYFFLPRLKQDGEGNWVERTEEELDGKEKIGFIQTPQTFYNPDLFQYNLYSEGKIPNEQDYFFRQVNVGKNRTNSPIYAGSNTVISREALEEVGGICTGTITEDFETGLMIESRGYRCYAVNKMLAKGMAPVTIDGLIKQRERWARGCIYSLRRVHLLLNPKFNFHLKMSYLACRVYWGTFTRRLMFIAAPILFVLFGIPVVICGVKELLFIWLPSYILYAVTLRRISGEIRNTRWSNIIDTTIFPYMILPIWAECLFIRKKNFHVTSKKKANMDNKTGIMALPHIVLLALSVLAMALQARDLVLYQAFGSLVVIYWLLVNSSSLVMAVFFMLGRKNERLTERFTVDIPVEVDFMGRHYSGTVCDVSEGGFAFLMKEPIYLPHGNEKGANFRMKDRMYDTRLTGDIVTVIDLPRTGEWKYCVSITQMEEADKREYLQIIYDREHTLPKTLSRGSSYFGDISSNLGRRTTNRQQQARRLARIAVGEACTLADGRQVVLENYNFEFVRLSEAAGGRLPEELKLYPGTEYEMHCERHTAGINVYHIRNWKELLENSAFLEKMEGWGINEREREKRGRG